MNASTNNKKERTAVLKRLAGLSPIDFETEAKRLAKEWGVTRGAIRKEVEKYRAESGELSETTKKILDRIKTKKGLFVRNGNSYSILLDEELISVNAELENPKLAKLFNSVGGPLNFSNPGMKIVQELLIAASENADGMTVRKFSAVHESAVWIPTTTGLIRITANGGIKTKVPNGLNPVKLWLEHPENEPLKFDEAVDVGHALGRFEELVVGNAACVVPEMKWFLAMNFGLFPFIRASANRRMITQLHGPSQHGKTTLMERYNRMHGLGEVIGDAKTAGYANKGDIGFLAMDNKEARNMRSDLVDFLLFLATGSQYVRCYSDGTLRPVPNGRPVGAVTSIEGFSKNELQLRTVVIEIRRQGPAFNEAPITEAILRERHEMLSALTSVLQRYLQLGPSGQAPPPDSTFPDHWEVLCRLLQAYADVTKRGRKWCDEIIAVWRQQLSRDQNEHEESEYETLLNNVFDRSTVYEARIHSISSEQHVWNGQEGTVFVVQSWGSLLDVLSRNNTTRIDLPKTGEGLSSRIRSDAASFHTLKLLPQEAEKVIPALKRKNTFRPMGFFRADE